MTITTGLAITSLYASVLALLFIPFTLRVGLYRRSQGISLGDGGNEEMLKRMRGQGNFIETVPLALALLALMELGGASATWLHCLGSLLVAARISHYLNITGLVSPIQFRAAGMMGTLSVYLIGASWLLLNVVF